MSDARARLVAALDLPDRRSACAMADRLVERVGWFKIGLELFVAEDRASSRRSPCAAGLGGIVASTRELPAQRAAHPGLRAVVPGTRPAGSSTGDQRRVATPEQAIRAGASLLVVGRPILAAPDPAAAARVIVDESEHAFRESTKWRPDSGVL